MPGTPMRQRTTVGSGFTAYYNGDHTVIANSDFSEMFFRRKGDTRLFPLEIERTFPDDGVMYVFSPNNELDDIMPATPPVVLHGDGDISVARVTYKPQPGEFHLDRGKIVAQS